LGEHRMDRIRKSAQTIHGSDEHVL
jgi:hypothetical protein